MTNVVFPILNEPNNHKVIKLIFKKNPNAVTLSAHKRKKKQLIKLDSGIFNSSKTFWKYIPENTFLSIF